MVSSSFASKLDLSTPAGLKAGLRQNNVKTKSVKAEYFTGPTRSARSADLFNISGSGMITEFEFICSDAIFQYDGLIEIYVDGAVDGSPSLLIPYGLIMGYVNGNALNTASPNYIVDPTHFTYGNARFRTPNFEVQYCAYSVQSNASCGGMKFIMRFPIPYSNGIRAKLYNTNAGADANTTSYWFNGQYTDQFTSPLRLKGQGVPTFDQSSVLPTNATTAAHNAVKDLFTLAAGNSGCVVAHWLTLESFATDGSGSTILERDLFFYRDGESTASWQSSGLEDAFDDCFYYNAEINAQSSLNCFLSMQRISGNGGNHHGSQFADILSKSGGFNFSNGGIYRWECNPDDAAGRVGSTAVIWSFILYYQ